ncbi:sensor histidine kinase [Paenibacillaceae bacterium WGS1546]|uniref:cache domain-containing sensor histidine kinase n=1 Tax=Cohnella sp. WGS1546 TaxID=3366810 RepID=UPI00372D068C
MRNLPLFAKISLVFSLIVTCFILLIGYSSYSVYRSSMEAQAGDFVPQILEQTGARIESYVDELLLIPQSIFYMPGVRDAREILRQANASGAARSLDDTLELHAVLDRLNFRAGENLQAITFYALAGDAYVLTKGGGMWVEEGYRKQPWFDELDTEFYTPTIWGTYQDQSLTGRPYVFSILQPVNDSQQRRLEGVIQVSGSVEAISAMVRKVDFGEGSIVYVLDHRNHIVYSTNSSSIGQAWNRSYGFDWGGRPVGSDSFELVLEGKPYLFSYNWSADSGWKVVGIIPSENMSKGIYRIKFWTYAIVASGILIVFGMALAIAYGFTKPLRKLSDRMKHLDLQQPAPLPSVDRLDEVGHLSNSFQNMIKRMNSLFGEITHEKVLKQEAEIKALQSQINPHFMHNALETIRMTYKSGRHENGEQGLVSLGHVLRYQAAQEQDFVPVAVELEFLDRYLSLQKLRYGDRLIVHMEVDPEVKKHAIPYMIIQPLVENALKYGASSYDHTISLTIRLGVEEGFITGSVIDEGQGMPPERLEQVVAEMSDASRHRQGRIGLANVYQRLRLLFGPLSELAIESHQEVGTIASFRFPIRPTHKGKSNDANFNR